MSGDFEKALQDIASAAGADVRAVPLETVTARLRRGRVARTALRSGGALAAVGAVVAGVTALGMGPLPRTALVPEPPATADTPEPTADPTAEPTVAPTPEETAPPTTPLPGWVVGAAPCGQVLDATPTDSDVIEIHGQVVPARLDLTIPTFTPDPEGDHLFVDVTVTSEHPGRPAGDGTTAVQTYLLDADGAVAFWDDPTLGVHHESADGSTSTAYGGFAAVDCRTGRPLAGQYSAIAWDAVAGELVELAPVTFGEGGSRPVAPGTLPTCGEPLDPALVDPRAADLELTLDPATPLTGVTRAGLHADVVATATGHGGTSTLSGLVPQLVRGFLVDADGVVAAQADPWTLPYLSGERFSVAPGESFATELFVWFNSCPMPDTWGSVEPGTYDLYLYETIPAESATGRTAPRLALGGPYRIELVHGGWG